MEFFLGALTGAIVGLIITWIVCRQIFASKLLAKKAELQQEAEQAAKASADQAFAKREDRLKAELAEDRAKLDADQERLNKASAKQDKREHQLDQREDSVGSKESNVSEREHALSSKQSSIDKRDAKLTQREEALEEAQEALQGERQSLAEQEAAVTAKLHDVAGLSPDEARQALFDRLDEELAAEQGAMISKRLADTEATIKEQATELVARAVQRYAAEHCAETTTAKVELADDDMKGRIIGKEGRNIRAFEMTTGVDLIIDDTPGVITVSCFDSMRREIARRTLVELLEDGRIQPARIEEVLAKVQQEIDREVLKMGEDAAYAADVSGLHPQILKLLGKLHFRTSYGQNVLVHSQEVAHLTAALCADMGLDPRLGRRCGLLHDIGKALDQEHEGSHPELGFAVLQRYGENEAVCNAALAHHEGHDVLTVYTTLTAAADAISAARPGARRENAERYIKRLEQLEDIACCFKGVMKAFAIQAGRELRVIANANIMQDEAMPKTARAIARRIEDEVAYPGEVKVTVIRETRKSAVAR